MSSEQVAWVTKVLDAFVDAGLGTDDEIAAARGPSDTTLTTWRNLLVGKRDSIPTPRAPTYRNVDRAAKWADGEARRLWSDPSRIPVGAPTQDTDYVKSPGGVVDGGESASEVLRAINEMRRATDQVLAEQRAMRERLERLEQRGT